MKTRVRYLDYIKTVAIILVIYCHYPVAGASVLANITLQFTTTVGVPLFLMVNGAILLEEKGFNLRSHLQKTGMLFVATCAWKLVYYLIMLMWEGKTYTEISKWQFFYYLSGQNITSPLIPTEHFWFMYALIGIYLLFPLVKTLYDWHREIIRYLAVLLFAYVFALTELNHAAALAGSALQLNILDAGAFRSATFPLAQGADLLLYFLLGGALHRVFYKEKETTGKWWVLPGVACCAFALLLLQRFLQQGSLRGEWVPLVDDYQRIGTLILSVCIYLIIMKIEQLQLPAADRAVCFVSQRTMNIYAVHMLFCLFYVRNILPVFSSTRVLVHVLRTLGILIVSILVTEPVTFIPGLRHALGLKPVRRKGSGK